MQLIRLTVLIFTLVGTFNGNNPEYTTDVEQNIIQDTSPETENIVTRKMSSSVEPEVKAYFADMPLLSAIAKCESTYKHVGESGEIIRGTVNKYDIGVMQINEKYHKDDAEKLGFDLQSLEGNMAYARYLYNKHGSDPWIASRECWSKVNELALR